MELQTVLTKYLETHKRIVVPQLGAFLVKEPGRSILFSELMKRDDGVLRGLLMADGRSEVEAAGAIDRFVFEVRHAVESGTEYRLADFGTMMPGPNGTIRFSYRPGLRPIRPVEPVPAPSVVRQTPPVPNLVEKPAPEPTADAVPASTKNPAPRAEEHSVQPVEPEPSYKSHIDTARVAETVRMAFSDEPDEPDDADAPTKKASAKRAARSYEYEADKEAGEAYSERRPARRKFDRFLFLAILAAVIAVAAIAFGFWREARERQAEEALQQLEQIDPRLE